MVDKPRLVIQPTHQYTHAELAKVMRDAAVVVAANNRRLDTLLGIVSRLEAGRLPAAAPRVRVVRSSRPAH